MILPCTSHGFLRLSGGYSMEDEYGILHSNTGIPGAGDQVRYKCLYYTPIFNMNEI